MQNDQALLRSRLALLLGLLLLSAVLVIDFGVIGRTITLKSAPDFSAIYLLRMGLLAAAALALVMSAAIFPDVKSDVKTGASASEPASGAPRAPHPRLVPADSGLASWDSSVVLPLAAAATPTIAFATLILVDPKVFSTLGSEENLVEKISEALLFAATALLVARTVTLRRTRNRPRLLFSAALALVFFVISMEEISWFQRILGIEKPPSIFSGNLQEETNFHNFFTHPVEMAYYTAAYALLILVPFLNERFRLFERVGALAELVPSRAILFLAAPLAFINYADWNRLPEQTIAFLTLLILGYYALRLKNAGRATDAFLTCAFIAILVGAQAIFILEGDNLNRFWQTTEYKEFFICLGFAAYAIQLRRSSKARI